MAAAAGRANDREYIEKLYLELVARRDALESRIEGSKRNRKLG